MQLRLELGKLLEEPGLFSEEDGELHEELLEGQLLDGQLDDSLLHFSLDEELKLQELLEMLLKLQLPMLLEQQGLLNDEDVELQDRILDKELSEEQLNDKLEDFTLDELH